MKCVCVKVGESGKFVKKEELLDGQDSPPSYTFDLKQTFPLIKFHAIP